MKYQDPKFDKADYSANREAGWRGQGEHPTLSTTLRPGTILRSKTWFTATPAFMGINAFKRKHTPSYNGHYNPKHRSIRGDVLKKLKIESWAELVLRERKYY